MAAMCGLVGQILQTTLNYDLLLRFIEVQALLLAPITPHVSEHIWSEMLKKVRRICGLINARARACRSPNSPNRLRHAWRCCSRR